MARSKTRTAKRNKKARASKAMWEKRGAILKDITKTNLFEDVVKTQSIHFSEDMLMEVDGDPQIEEINILQNENKEESAAECEIRRNPLWCHRKYLRKPSNLTPPSFGKSGIISNEDYERINNTPLNLEHVQKEINPIVGNRIVELGYVLDWAIDLQYNHSKVCTCGKVYVAEEKRKGLGLVSTIVFKCTMCPMECSFQTEHPNEAVSDINYGAVWGTLSTGSSYTHMEEFLSCINIPAIPDNMFYEIEEVIGESVKESMSKAMLAAGKCEKENAIACGQVCSDGVPWIRVYVDGSWSKRSYGTNFNALSGMAAIIGTHTGQVLYLGVRNKFCSVCARAENKNDTPIHQCFKNWTESAPAMEPDIVVDGFIRSESMHGVRYLEFIGDGDSSVFARIRQKVPYGEKVQKIECSNHALKNYGKTLRKIKADTSINIEGRKLLTAKKIDLLTKRAKCSLYEHSKKAEHNIEVLKNDLKNNLHHVFGDHSECREGTCNNMGDQTDNKIPALMATNIYNHLHGAQNLLIRKAHLLIKNENNNRSEQLMNIVARFNMGKRLNLIQRGSYERRVHMAALRFNRSFDWLRSPWKRCTTKSPGDNLNRYIRKHTIKSERKNCRRRLFGKTSTKRKENILQNNPDYGAAIDEPEDKEDVEFIMKEAQWEMQKLQLTSEHIISLERSTVGQFSNSVYERERTRRLTASLFGRVIKRRSHTSCNNLVKTCLEGTSFTSAGTDYGIAKEDVVKKIFEKTTNLPVRDSGLWVDEQYGFLAASPDGLVGENDIIEVKCIYQPTKDFRDMKDAVEQLKSKICLMNTDSGLKLKTTHNYYYQVQGQLNISRKRKCYFVVYINDSVPIHIEEIYRDESIWNECMLPKLMQFYKYCIAPELVRGNLKKKKRCVDPDFILQAIEAKKQS